MTLSVVTTMYYSSPYIREFYERISRVAKNITDDYEIIFVNDGSPDNSLESVLAIYETDPKVRIIDLSRNFGHHKAIMTGLSHAKGEFVFLIDVDLEERPELLEQFWAEMQVVGDIDVVYGVQEKRRGGWFERISGNVFYKIFNYFSTTKIPENIITARLMKKRYVSALVSFREQEIFLAGLWATTGFNQKGITVEKLDHSTTTYSIRKRIAVLINSITSFTNKPLIFIFYLGSFISFFSFFYIVYLIFRKLYYGIGLVGWTSLIASIWMVGGVIIFSLGVVGIYISKIFMEVKNRPYTVIKRHYDRDRE